MEDDVEASALPLRTDLYCSLDGEDVLNIFCNASTLYKDQICDVPPVLPKAEELFLFDLGDDESLWDNYKRKYRLVTSCYCTIS